MILTKNTQSDPQISSYSSYSAIDFTVHDYQCGSPNASISRAPEDILLEQGYSLIRAVLPASKVWHNPRTTPLYRAKSGNSYVFGKTPPSVPFDKSVWQELKAWGAPAIGEEVYRLEELDEFVGTDLSSIFRQEEDVVARPPTLVSLPQKRERPLEPAAELDLKRRKLHAGSLHRFVPRPHIHPSPFLPAARPLKGRPFKKTEPTYIAPYTTFSLPDDALVAWLIPVRGTLPWQNTTSGGFLETSNTIPRPPQPGIDDQISWTHTSLLKFWDFLLDLRKAGSLGALGVSFHGTENHKPSTTATNHDYPVTPDRFNTAETAIYQQAIPISISMVDYIKIYHEASRRLYVRSALDAWAFEATCPNDKQSKIRLFKGARLVLLDASSKGIHIS
ncbi:hypothetical protein B0H34DRAFT_800418 [Crassisporium funariophilum]|nr:hypothetical protein B0H34DRAFT_800418 [Crassisporium funariophilum]